MVDETLFKDVMREFPTGVTVVTTLDELGRLTGLTVSSFTSLSLEPPLVLICVSYAADCYPSLRERGEFAVNVLAHGQDDLAWGFALAGQGKIDWIKRQNPSWQLGPRGIPTLGQCLAVFECRLVHTYPGGDHAILVGEVLSAIKAKDKSEPLVYHRSGLTGLAKSS